MRTCPAHFGMHDMPCRKGCGDICIAAAPEKVNAALAKAKENEARYLWLRENWMTQQPSVTVWWKLPLVMSAVFAEDLDKAVDAARVRTELSDESSGSASTAARTESGAL